MDRIGSIDEALIKKTILRAMLDDNASQTISETHLALAREEGFRRSLEMHQMIGRSSIGTILFMERCSLTLDMKLAADRSQATSLKKAIDQVGAARNMLSQTESSDEYKKMVEDLPPQEKEKDLPYDTVRRFFSSHTTRLQKRIKYELNASEGQQAILKQRLKNIRQAETKYIGIQRQILGGDRKPAKDYTKMPPLSSDPITKI